MSEAYEPVDDARLVTYERRGAIGFITLNRPEVLNAVTDEMIRELRERIVDLDQDDDALVGIIGGAGRAFCSGADVRKRHLQPRENMARQGGPVGAGAFIQDLTVRLVNWKPLIAAVHGYVLGAGLRIALQSELIVAAPDTRFQVTEVQRGLDPNLFWTQLAARGGGDFATEVSLTGRFWTAEEAYERNIVSRVAVGRSHVEEAEDLAAQIARNPPLAVRALVRGRRLTQEALELEARTRATPGLYLTDDFREASAAFVEKREPRFTGR